MVFFRTEEDSTIALAEVNTCRRSINQVMSPRTSAVCANFSAAATAYLQCRLLRCSFVKHECSSASNAAYTLASMTSATLCHTVSICARALHCRERSELSRCRCIAALCACLGLVEEEELDWPWPAVSAKNTGPYLAPGWRLQQSVAEPVVEENYLTWTNDCARLAQVLLPLLENSALQHLHYDQGIHKGRLSCNVL